MNDKELLDLAAKAAGIDGLEWNGIDGQFECPVPHKGGTNYCIWNPLTDDGDALRLAVKLRLTIQFPWDEQERFTGDVCVWSSEPDSFDERIAQDPNSATRRAIVRAAAEIGKAMP